MGLPGARGATHQRNPRPISPAAVSLQVGDVVLRFDGVVITDDNHLVNVVSLTQVGRIVPLVVLREGHERLIKVRVGSLESKAALQPVSRRCPTHRPVACSFRPRAEPRQRRWSAVCHSARRHSRA